MMRWTIGSALALVVVIAPSPAVASDRAEMEREGLQLVRQVEEVGRDVRYHAERLSHLVKSTGISRWTHYHHLDEVKRLVNTGLRPALARLSEIQGALPTWKQKSVDDLIDAARTLATDTSSAYMTKAENPKVEVALNEEYRTLVSEIFRHADSVVTTAGDAVKFAEWRLQLIEAGIPIPTS